MEVLGQILLLSGRVGYARRDLKLHQTWVIEKYVTSTLQCIRNQDKKALYGIDPLQLLEKTKI